MEILAHLHGNGWYTFTGKNGTIECEKSGTLSSGIGGTLSSGMGGTLCPESSYTQGYNFFLYHHTSLLLIKSRIILHKDQEQFWIISSSKVLTYYNRIALLLQ